MKYVLFFIFIVSMASAMNPSKDFQNILEHEDTLYTPIINHCCKNPSPKSVALLQSLLSIVKSNCLRVRIMLVLSTMRATEVVSEEVLSQDKVMQYLDDALLNGNNYERVSAYLNKGRLLFSQNVYSEAKECLEKAQKEKSLPINLRSEIDEKLRIIHQRIGENEV